MDQKYTKKQQLKRIRNIVLVLLLILVIGIPVFGYINLRTQGQLAFREAKNVKIHLQMLDIEQYSQAGSIYSTSSKNGLAPGVEIKIKEFLENDCEVSVTSYDKTKRAVTGFVYKRGKYQVEYYYDKEKGDVWKVKYVFDLVDYDGE